MKRMTRAVSHYHLITIYQNFSINSEAVGSYETSVNFYHFTCHHIPKDSIPQYICSSKNNYSHGGKLCQFQGQ